MAKKVVDLNTTTREEFARGLWWKASACPFVRDKWRLADRDKVVSGLCRVAMPKALAQKGKECVWLITPVNTDLHGVIHMQNKQCGAKTRAGHPCKMRPMLGKSRCLNHGGGSLLGNAHPSYVHGLYSRMAYAWFLRKKDQALRSAVRKKIAYPMDTKRPHERRPPLRKEHVAPVRCGAKNRQGNPCQKWPIRDRNRCRNHGGRSLRGVNSPSFINGKHSKLLPRNLMGKMLRFYGIERLETKRKKTAKRGGFANHARLKS